MSTRYKVTLVNGDGSHEDSFSAAAGRNEKAAAMLYQAADKLEREEKYEYAVIETIEDIVKEMRYLGRLDEKSTDRIPRSLQALCLRTYADRIERAADATSARRRSSLHESSEEDVRLYASNGSTVVRRLVGELEPVPRRCGE